MGEVIFLRHGLFGPKISRTGPVYGVIKRRFMALARITGQLLATAGRLLKGALVLIWMSLTMVAMLPVLAIYAVIFIFSLAVGFTILFDIGRAMALFSS